MSKGTITKLFIGSTITVGAGAIVAIASVWLAIANDVVVMNGPDIVAVQGSALAWLLLGFGLVGGLTVAGGSVA